ncbi:MAG: ABC transporter permease [Nitrosomonadales bacterium]|jgi:phospholipid/cholesterol/gamma-HCH transport system permease protein|nr:MAG: ABC transporter permease [Nitrosomonadales bacterium]
MRQNSLSRSGFDTLANTFVRSVTSWWRVIHFGAVALVMVLSPSIYDRENRSIIAKNIYTSTWQVLLWFTSLCALISLVLVRIIVVTALSYGLSQYALEVVVRVLVLELIPLGAALFVVLRSNMEISSTPIGGSMRTYIVPRLIATAFSVVTLAAVSSLVALVMAYIVVYGFSPWGFTEYTRMVGRVFDPGIAVAFIFKTVLFSLAVAIIPIASAIQGRNESIVELSSVQRGTVRLFLVLVLIEGSSLAIKFI